MRLGLKRAAAITGLAAVAVTLSLVLVVAFFDWGLLRDPIERAVAARTGRELAIGGEVTVDLGWRTEIVLNDVRLSNPGWARRPSLLEARRVTVIVSLPVLLVGRPRLHEVTLEQPRLALERRDGARTWALGREGTGRVPEIGRLRIDDGAIEYLDRAANTEIVAQVASAGRETHDDMKVSAKGTLRGAPFSLDASGPTVLLLADPAEGYPLEATVRAGATSARVSGTVFELAAPRALDLAVEVAGEDLAGLRTLLGISLASSPPYKLRGRLRRGEAGWRLDDITGRIGDSDVAGALAYVSAPRPHLEMKIVSERLDFDDLGPLIGAPPKTTAGETASPEQRRKARAMREAGQALPDQRFDAGRWQGLDVDASLVGRKVVHPPALPIQSLDARLRIRDGVLRLEPLTLQTAGGQVVATVELDARDRPVRGIAVVEFRGLQLRELFPTVAAMKKARGVAHGRARLAGNGTSVAELLGSANGRVSLAVDRGSISNLVLELLGLDAGEAILLFATGDRDIALRCAVADLDVRDGVATSNVLVLDTADTLVVGAGVIDLRRERLDLTLYPRPKDASILAARSPLRVRGTLRDPQVTPDARSLATRGATAALLALVNPLLALASFIETGPGEDSDCARLLGQAKTWTNPAAPRDAGTAVKPGARP